MRRVEKTRLTLEMLSPDQLIRAKPDSRLKLRTVSESDPVLERLFREVGGPHLWSWESWSTYGAPPAKRNWLIQVDEKPAGLLTLLDLPEGDVEMVTFGLLPRYQGQGSTDKRSPWPPTSRGPHMVAGRLGCGCTPTISIIPMPYRTTRRVASLWSTRMFGL